MTSTKQHWGHKDVYLSTLNHWARQLSFDTYSIKVAHIKISPDELVLGAQMTQELENRGFEVLTTIADWHRGESHQNQYLLDQIKISKHNPIYFNPYILYVEDDSPVVLSTDSTLDKTLSMMCDTLADINILSARFMRQEDYPPAGEYRIFHPNWLRHNHINFQPLVMRSAQFYTMLKTAEDNLYRVSNVQIEMLWRLLLAPYSRESLPHLVIRHELARTIHLGVPDYLKVRAALNLG